MAKQIAEKERQKAEEKKKLEVAYNEQRRKAQEMELLVKENIPEVVRYKKLLEEGTFALWRYKTSDGGKSGGDNKDKKSATAEFGIETSHAIEQAYERMKREKSADLKIKMPNGDKYHVMLLEDDPAMWYMINDEDNSIRQIERVDLKQHLEKEDERVAREEAEKIR